MFGLLRRKAAPRQLQWSAPGGFAIPVSDAAFGPDAPAHDAVMALVQGINRLLDQGHYRPNELPRDAIALYQADYYVGQVQNGGHSQYIHNIRARSELLGKARDGLALCADPAVLAAFDGMRDWVATHPDDAAKQTGFDVRSEALDPIDGQFFGLDLTESWYRPVQNWMRSSPSVQIMPASALADRFEALTHANRNRASRLQQRRVQALHHRFSDPWLSAFVMAAAGQGRDGLPLVVKNITAGFEIGHPDGPGHPIWAVQTSAGPVCGYVTDQYAVLATVSREQGFSAGAPLWTAPLAPARAYAEWLCQHEVAALAAHLLAQVNTDDPLTSLSPIRPSLTTATSTKGQDATALIGITAGDRAFDFVIGERFAEMRARGRTAAMARLTAKQMARVQARARQARDDPPM